MTKASSCCSFRRPDDTAVEVVVVADDRLKELRIFSKLFRDAVDGGNVGDRSHQAASAIKAKPQR